MVRLTSSTMVFYQGQWNTCLSHLFLPSSKDDVEESKRVLRGKRDKKQKPNKAKYSAKWTGQLKILFKILSNIEESILHQVSVIQIASSRLSPGQFWPHCLSLVHFHQETRKEGEEVHHYYRCVFCICIRLNTHLWPGGTRDSLMQQPDSFLSHFSSTPFAYVIRRKSYASFSKIFTVY